MVALFVETIGCGSPPLLLLHGLGANGAVWERLVSKLRGWPGQIIIPDLRGHGRSPHVRPYTLGHHAGDVADIVAANEPVYVVGHSMGAMVGLVLASGWFGVDVKHVLALGTKVGWNADEIARLKTVAAAPPRLFETREEAAERFLRVAGLAGIVNSVAEVVKVGVVPQGEKFRLAADPATVLVTGAAIGPALAASRASWQLACGDSDPLVDITELQASDMDAIAIHGCAHNPHVEAPAQVCNLILGALRGGISAIAVHQISQ